MQYLEKRRRLFYAVLTVPTEVREQIGESRFVKSTGTADPVLAQVRALTLVAGWKAQIAKARGSLPDPKQSHWDMLRQELAGAKDEAHAMAIEDLIEKAAEKIADRGERVELVRYATGASTPLAPLVTSWMASLRIAQKSKDQQHRDVKRMADHFLNLEALTPETIKKWIDKLLVEKVTASSFERIGNGCRSLWQYLQESGARRMLDPDPFVGPFRLAQKMAVKNTITRKPFTPEEAAMLHAQALLNEDQPLADLIALGAYTGARIEELCSLTAEDCKLDRFKIEDAKTTAGNREVPIHPVLAPLLTRLINQAGKGGFMVASAADNQYGNRSGPVSQRFGHLKSALKFTKAHVFHSFRHTMVTQLHRGGVAPAVIAHIVGHETGEFSLDKYGEGSSLEQKADAIAKVCFPGSLSFLAVAA